MGNQDRKWLPDKTLLENQGGRGRSGKRDAKIARILLFPIHGMVGVVMGRGTVMPIMGFVIRSVQCASKGLEHKSYESHPQDSQGS